MPDVQQFNLPDVGEGLTEAEIVSWRVKPGDTIKVNDIIVEIETAKSLVELPSPFAGTVADLLVPEGTTVAVGTPIISVNTGSGGAAAPAESSDEAAAAVPSDVVAPAESSDVAAPAAEQAVEPGMIGGPAPGGRTSVLVGYGPRTTEAKRRPRKGSVPETPSPAAAQAGVQSTFQPEARAPSVPLEDAQPAAVDQPAVVGQPSEALGSRALAKPPVRKLAKDLGVDLVGLVGSGAGGVVTRADVEAAAGGSQEPAPLLHAVSAPPVGGETRIPVKGVRKVTAAAMVASAFTAPHVTEWITIDATRTMKLVRMLKSDREFRDVKVSPLLVVARAVCLAARRTPEVNATWDEAAQEIVVKHYVNLGIAAATPRGLMVPNVKGADSLSTHGLALALGELTTRAREGKTQPEEMSGGTFTITNVGVFGVDSGTPILNPGESGILAMGAIRRQPWVHAGKVKPRWITTLALSFDHRVVDGEQGSRFLADVAAIVEDPGSALLF
jgi:2-oxoisovalerate dehydrogenase E2 component (dihydrolipoyl transacylase)